MMITRCFRQTFPFLTAALLFAASGDAQTLPAIDAMPIHFGPFGLTPSIAITDIGVDSNVFNDAEHPQEDFSATITPKLLARLRVRRVMFSYSGSSELVYFQKFTGERSANANTEVRVDTDLGRLQPYFSAGWLSTKQRMNNELDKRAPRTQPSLSAGTRILVASRTALVATVRRQDIEFDQGVFFRGVELAHTLNSRTNSGELALQLALTPLTTFSFATTVQQDRFDHAPERDADTLRLVPSFRFDPTSLLRGTVAVGYRKFHPRSPELPEYSGIIVQTTVGYTLLERTRFDVDVQRDVQYSYEELEPYYLSTGGRLTVTQQLIGDLDIQGVAGRQNMAYRAAGIDGSTRNDTARIYSAGAGYRIRENARLGVTWEYTRRQSALDQRQYERRRIFASLTLGS